MSERQSKIEEKSSKNDQLMSNTMAAIIVTCTVGGLLWIVWAIFYNLFDIDAMVAIIGIGIFLLGCIIYGAIEESERDKRKKERAREFKLRRQEKKREELEGKMADTREFARACEEGDPSEPDQMFNGISKQYFDDINGYITQFLDFADKISQDKGFAEDCNNLDNVCIQFTEGPMGNNDPETFKGKLEILTFVDTLRNFQYAGYPLDLMKKEQLGILLYMLRDFGSVEIKYEYLSIYYEGGVSGLENLAQQMFAVPEIEEKFYIFKLLSGYNDEKAKKYLVMQYRLISLASKCDGVVTDQEAQWMKEILKLEETCKADAHGDEAPGSDKRDHIAELNNLIGLATVKKDVITLTDLIKIQELRKEKGLKVNKPSFHCVFTGNPGTGKTTVARILAGIYRELGVLKQGQLIETDRSGLVAEYVGQTAVKTNKIIDKALDGVLFIDEAYTLVSDSKSDYGNEAIATLLKRMEDDRDRLVVILAGYTDEMKEFIDSNPGLQSRFSRYIFFPDYDENELMQIFELNLDKYEYKLSAEAKEKLARLFANAVATKDKNFGNGRFVRNVFDKTIERQASRLASISNVTVEQLSLLTAEDIPDQTE